MNTRIIEIEKQLAGSDKHVDRLADKSAPAWEGDVRGAFAVSADNLVERLREDGGAKLEDPGKRVTWGMELYSELIQVRRNMVDMVRLDSGFVPRDQLEAQVPR